jgi:hypothetical protein
MLRVRRMKRKTKISVRDVENVFRFASLFYHNRLRFSDVVRFRMKMLGVENFGLVQKPSGATLGPRATETTDVIVRKELWKLLLPDMKYSVIVEAYYAIDDCEDLDFCIRLETIHQPLWYKVEAVVEGDIEEIGEADIALADSEGED